jgi:hypothetical protein
MSERISARTAWVIAKKGGIFLAATYSSAINTADPRKARKFSTRESAVAASTPGEVVLKLSDVLEAGE